MKDFKLNPKIVYAYVVADILNVGHIKHLENSKRQGDFLIVGCLSDKATLEKKPIPIVSFEERMETIASVRYVDKVVIQDEYSPLENIKKIKPDVLMESDSHDKMPANDYVKGYGGEIVITPYFNGTSSTDIKNKVKNNWRCN